jgi:hypothetical protein
MSLKRVAAQEVEKSNAIDMCFCQGALKKVHRTEVRLLQLLFADDASNVDAGRRDELQIIYIFIFHWRVD